jgi:hypothetical protein
MKTGSFSLTLTLSRWEREQPLDDFAKLASPGAEAVSYFAMKGRHDFAETLGAFLLGERAGVRENEKTSVQT